MVKSDLKARRGAPSLAKSRFAVVAGVAALAITGAAIASSATPIALWNTTPSEPEGLYLRSTASPAIGAIIAFRLPAPGQPYASLALPHLRSRPLLKAVAAGPGDLVCAGESGLAVNGHRLAPIATHDHLGRGLPRWLGCRRLGTDELFVFSARVPNSFDSRYFGPVSQADVLGVYRLAAPTAKVGI